MLDATVGALGFYLLGYGFAYGDRYECAPRLRGVWEAGGSATKAPDVHMRRCQASR